MDKFDKCPKCGGELTAGILRASREGVYWDDVETKWQRLGRPEAKKCNKCNVILVVAIDLDMMPWKLGR